jgi:hypothetical protein
LLALLGADHILHVSRILVKGLCIKKDGHQYMTVEDSRRSGIERIIIIIIIIIIH